MPRASRLTSASDIRRAYSQGRKASSPAVVAHVLLSGEARPARVGVSAARGIGGAVQRNRAKRRIREAVRELDRPLAPGADVMLVANRRATTTEFQELVDSVGAALHRAGGLVA
jgi:ribonuclease P protein component